MDIGTHVRFVKDDTRLNQRLRQLIGQSGRVLAGPRRGGPRSGGGYLVRFDDICLYRRTWWISPDRLEVIDEPNPMEGGG